MLNPKKRKTSRESQLSTEQVKKAVPALLAYLEKKPKKAKQLYDESTAFWLLMSLKKIPAADRKPHLIPLPNSFNDDSEVCLFSKLPGKQVKELLEAKGVTNISKVISLTKLRKEYKSYELKRNLCSQFKIFICDETIYHLLPKSLGKTFFSRRKEPTPINLTKVDLKQEVDRAVNGTKVRFGHGSCSAVKVGNSGQTEDEIIQNIVAVAEGIAKNVPRGWNNIQSIHLKTSESIALPLYNSLPDVEIVIESEKPPLKKKRKNE